MDIEAISGAATVALTSTVVFLLIAKFWSALTRTVGSGPRFADSIMHEAAQRFRDELDKLSSSQAIYLGAALVFAMLFAAAYLLQARALFAGYPDWQLYLQLGFLALALVFAAYQLGSTILAGRQVRFQRDANIAIGHQLHQISSGVTRVYHDVETTAGVVDHVVVGQNGIYAINVVAKHGGKSNVVRLSDNALQFTNAKLQHSIVDIAARTSRLEKDLRKLLGHKIRVRSVIAVPGWDIGEQSSEQHLLVNERNVAMLRGWRDSSDHLLNEDVDALQKHLTAKCLRSA